MTDADVIAAIRRCHLQVNIAEWERDPVCVIHWDRAHVDSGGTIFGPGPYLHVPVTDQGEDDGRRVRVHAPAWLRQRLAREWVREP